MRTIIYSYSMNNIIHVYSMNTIIHSYSMRTIIHSSFYLKRNQLCEFYPDSSYIIYNINFPDFTQEELNKDVKN